MLGRPELFEPQGFCNDELFEKLCANFDKFKTYSPFPRSFCAIQNQTYYNNHESCEYKTNLDKFQTLQTGDLLVQLAKFSTKYLNSNIYVKTFNNNSNMALHVECFETGRGGY